MCPALKNSSVMPLVYVLQVALLQEARVSQHDVAELRRRLPREDAPAEALAHELRQVAGVVDVRVGEDHVVDLRGIDWEVPVLFERLLAVVLVQPAVEQYPLAVRFYKMHGAGRRLRRSVESYSHAMIIPKFTPCGYCKTQMRTWPADRRNDLAIDARQARESTSVTRSRRKNKNRASRTATAPMA